MTDNCWNSGGGKCRQFSSLSQSLYLFFARSLLTFVTKIVAISHEKVIMRDLIQDDKIREKYFNKFLIFSKQWKNHSMYKIIFRLNAMTHEIR